MKMLLPGLAKRLLSFALALVLLLSLCPVLPLTADAAVDLTGWEFHNTYKQYFTTAQFISNDTDLVFAENQDYDWYIKFGHNYGSNISLSVEATITDSSGASVGSHFIPATTLKSGTVFSICKVTDFTNFDRTMPGTYTLVVEFYSGTTGVARLTKEFTREGVDNNAAFTESSRSKPNKLFTFADPIDLELNIVKTNGVAEAFNAVTTITNANGETVVGPSNYPIPSSSNTTVSVKDLVDVTNIKTPGNYNVNVALNNDSGKERYSYSFPFAVVNVTRTISITISAADTYEDTDPTPVVKLRKPDGVTEYGSVTITVVNTETNKPVFSQTFEGDIPGDANGKSIYPKMLNFPLVGQFRMDVVAKDSDGITRGTDSTTFSCVSNRALEATLTDNITNNRKDGMIYSNTDNPLALAIDHPASAGKILQIGYSGIYNGETLNETKAITMPASGTVTLNATDFLKYGIYEGLRLSIYNAAGTLLWSAGSTYSFSFVIDNTNSASLPLLNMNVHYTNMGEDPMIEQVNFSAIAGTSAWRSSITWDAVEKVSGDYGVPEQLEAVMDQTKAKGMKALIILAYNNNNPKRDSNGSIIYDSNNKTLPMYGDPDPTNSEWLNAYTEYCKFVADYMNTYYPGMVVGYEIWNEWNNASMSKVNNEDLRKGNIYAQLVIAASEAIKEVDPNANIIGGATAGDADSNTLTFMKAMLGTDGLIDAIDGFSFHSYADKETTTEADRLQGIRRFERVSPAGYSFASRITNVKNLLAQYGAPDDLEIWLTETSWSTNAEPEEGTSPHDNKYHIYYGVTEEQQASYMVQLYTLALADGTLDRIFWYDLLNDRNNVNGAWTWQTNKGECNWGLLHTWDENATGEHIAYEAKQGYVAMCALNSKLAGATNGRSITLGSGIHAYQFEKDGHYLMVAWTTDGTTKNLTATLNGQMFITDMFGNETEYSGSAPLTLSESPIYIEYAMGSHPSIG